MTCLLNRMNPIDIGIGRLLQMMYSVIMNERTIESIAERVSVFTGSPVLKCTQIHGGGNNRVITAETEADTVLVKAYFQHPDDPRNRLETEFGVLTFLWENGMRCIPQPLYKDSECHMGIYSFVEGTRVEKDHVSQQDVEQEADMLRQMWDLKEKAKMLHLPDASDSAFSIGGHLKRVKDRYARFNTLMDNHQLPENLCIFLSSIFADTLIEIETWIRKTANDQGIEITQELDMTDRVLSPADHGLHNALRTADGNLMFIDFEYAGWDDPAQMISNACHQPAIPIPVDYRSHFCRYVLKNRGKRTDIENRLLVLHPLLGLKWALIMLNEYLPKDKERRRYSGKDPELLQLQQLEAAKRKVEWVNHIIGRGVTEIDQVFV